MHTLCKPYKCNHCGKTYKQISTLLVHKRTVHIDTEPIEEESEGYFEPPEGWFKKTNFQIRFESISLTSETGPILYSEAVDDPSLSTSPDKCDDSESPEMTAEMSDGQQHVTLITQDGTTQVRIHTYCAIQLYEGYGWF